MKRNIGYIVVGRSGAMGLHKPSGPGLHFTTQYATIFPNRKEAVHAITETIETRRAEGLDKDGSAWMQMRIYRVEERSS